MPGSRKIQHFTICVGNRPEDIQAWIAARKRNFPRQKKALDTLLDGYGSSSSSGSSSDSDANKETDRAAPSPKRQKITPESPAVVRETPPQQQQPAHRGRPVCRFFERTGTCRKGSSCAFAHTTTVTAPATTLLQRLLENDQRRERILTMQLLQYMLYDSPTLSKIGTTTNTKEFHHDDDGDGDREDDRAPDTV